MDIQSINQFEINSRVRLTLINNFWYRAKIISISEKSVEFIDDFGKKIIVSPEAILMLEELK